MSVWKISGILLVWGTAMVGVLQLQWLPVSEVHGVCGPWGCGPPFPALIAYHGFWVVVLSLPTWAACRFLSPDLLRRLGLWGAVGAFLGVVAICFWQRVSWWPDATGWQREYFPIRCAFMVITLIDVPLLQTLLASAVCGLVGLSIRGRKVSEWDDNPGDQPIAPISAAIHLGTSDEGQ